jgi:hypothetical protein
MNNKNKTLLQPNSSMAHHDVYRLIHQRMVWWVLIACSVLLGLSSHQVVAGSRLFVERTVIETKGNFEFIGNSAFVCQAGCSNNAHNYATMAYADVDGDASTFNSSSATLQMPENATVEWAGLYWGGTVDVSTVVWTGLINAPNGSQRNLVKLKTPQSNAYVAINATVSDTISGSPTTGWQAYQAFADVTDLVRNAGAGDYILANLQVDAGGGNESTSFTGPFGGWNLIVVYSHDDEKLRRINVWDGYDFIYFSSANKSFPISNIRTPLSGAFESEVAFSCYDGERANLNGGGYNGDFVAINQTSNALSNGLNAADNVCNGTISKQGANVTTRNPADTNTWGYDLDRFDLSNTGLIANNTNSLNVIFGSSNEGIWFGSLVFSTEIFPSLAVEKSVHGAAAPEDWAFTLSSNNCTLPTGLVNPVSVSGAGGTATFNNLPVNQGATVCEYNVSENTQAGYALNTSLSDAMTGITLSNNAVTTVRVTNQAQSVDNLTNCFSFVSADQQEGDSVDNQDCVSISRTLNTIAPSADYRFDECSWNGTTGEVIDQSSNQLHGFSKSGASISSVGKIYRAGQFDGANDWVKVENNPSLQLNTDLSLSLWVYPENINSDQTLIYKHHKYEYELFIRNTDKKLRFRHGDGSTESIDLNATTIPQNTWTHIAVVRDHNQKQLHWYLNGELVETDTYNKNPSNSSNYLRIGRRSANQAFQGKMDEVKIFNQPLSAEDIQQTYIQENAGKNADGSQRTPPSCPNEAAYRSSAASSVELADDGTLAWESVWVNEGIATAPYVEICAEIPEGTTFVPMAEAQSVSVDGVYCEAQGASAGQGECFYEQPSEAYPQGRVMWRGQIMSETETHNDSTSDGELRQAKAASTRQLRLGVQPATNTLAAQTDNEVVLRFNTRPTGTQAIIRGESYADWYLGGAEDADPDLRLFAAAPRDEDEPDNGENTDQAPVSIEIDPSNYSSSNDNSNDDNSSDDSNSNDQSTDDNSNDNSQTDDQNGGDSTQPPSNNDQTNDPNNGSSNGDNSATKPPHDGADMVSIPSLSEWGMMLLSLLLFLVGTYMQRRGRW